MTPLEAVLAFVLLVSAVGHVLQARTLDGVIAQMHYLDNLYCSAVRRIEAVTADRDGWRRLVAAVRDQRK